MIWPSDHQLIKTLEGMSFMDILSFSNHKYKDKLIEKLKLAIDTNEFHQYGFDIEFTADYESIRKIRLFEDEIKRWNLE